MAVNPHQSWFDVDGDNTYALDWDLNENSLVWEIGGFEGRWAQQIWDKFGCYIDIFEPQDWAYRKLSERFRSNDKISVLPYGLWVRSGTFPLGDYYTDGASLLKTKEPFVHGSEFHNIGVEIARRIPKDETVDLALMNIEGAEYELIPYLCKITDISKFDNFWCQFHPRDADDLRHLEIFKGMEHTHEMIWNFFPTAVAWRRK